MLDIKYIRENPQKVKLAIASKGVDENLVDAVLALDEKKRQILLEIETIRAKKNQAEKKILEEPEEIKKKAIIGALKEVKEFLDKKEEELKKIILEYEKTLGLLPNLPQSDVPLGQDENDNVVVKTIAPKSKFSFIPQDYLTLAEKLDLIDVARAAKTSGSRFGILKREAAILEVALVSYVFNKLLKKGFIPVIPPALIKKDIFWGTGYSERNPQETYYIPTDDLYLIGTAEHVMIGMYYNEILKETDLPLRLVGWSSCFRREAGSYGQDTKGIMRVHQFDKVEMVSFTTAEQSDAEHKFLLSLEEEIMQDFKLPYEVRLICTGDLSQPAAKSFDIYTFLPGQNKGLGEYRETHSCSNCTDYQARRLNIKVKRGDRAEFVHTLNGTAIAIGRFLIALMENYQTKEGYIKVPPILWKYTHGLKIIK